MFPYYLTKLRIGMPAVNENVIEIVGRGKIIALFVYQTLAPIKVICPPPPLYMTTTIAICVHLARGSASYSFPLACFFTRIILLNITLWKSGVRLKRQFVRCPLSHVSDPLLTVGLKSRVTFLYRWTSETVFNIIYYLNPRSWLNP